MFKAISLIFPLSFEWWWHRNRTLGSIRRMRPAFYRHITFSPISGNAIPMAMRGFIIFNPTQLTAMGIEANSHAGGNTHLGQQWSNG